MNYLGNNNEAIANNLGAIIDNVTLAFIKSDLYRLIGHSPSLREIFIYFVKNEVFRFLVCFRLLGATKCLIPKWYLKITKKLIGARRHLQIPQDVKIGFGLDLVHAIDIVINPTAVIGNNCNLSQFLNIGTNKGKAAIIGDCVYVGPHVCIVKDVTIGNFAVVGAGAIVTKDVAECATVAGNPAKVLNYKNAGKFCQYKWDFEKIR